MKKRERRPLKRSEAPPEERAFVTLLRVGDLLLRDVEGTLKQAGLTHTQYNVLRILRGAGPRGLPCSGVGERMLTHDPDITRLLDRMEKRGLIGRAREQQDRRVVTTRLMPAGLELLAHLDEPMRELHRRQLGHLGAKRLKELTRLLGLAGSETPPGVWDLSAAPVKRLSRQRPG